MKKWVIIALAISLALISIVFIDNQLSTKSRSMYCEYGDVDGDGDITLADVFFPAVTWDMKERGDVNNDGVFDSNDTSLIYLWVSGVITKFPIADPSNPAYQPDTDPTVLLYSLPENVEVGRTMALKEVVNDSNGEILVAAIRVYRNGIPVIEFPEEDIMPGSTYTQNYTFSSPGIYTIQGEVTYRFRASQWWFTSTTVNVESIITANFSYVVEGKTVHFYDLSSSDLPIKSWHWDFGDGETSTLQNPVHTYAKSGTYFVTLNVSNGVASSSIAKSIKISGFNYMYGIIALVGIVVVGGGVGIYKRLKK